MRVINLTENTVFLPVTTFFYLQSFKYNWVKKKSTTFSIISDYTNKKYKMDNMVVGEFGVWYRLLFNDDNNVNCDIIDI